MSADTISAVGGTPDSSAAGVTMSDGSGGGAGNGSGSPLVVVQPPKTSAPPRPAPDRSRSKADNSLRNGYAAISHSVSGEAAVIGLGFAAAGVPGAVLGGVAAPVTLAAAMWRARRRADDRNANRGDAHGSRSGSGLGSGLGSGSGSGGGRGRTGGGAGRGNSPGSGAAADGAGGRKPKIKDPVGDKLGKLGNSLADKVKPNKGPKGPKDGKGPKGKGGAGADGSGKYGRDPKGPKNGGGKGGKYGRDPKGPKNGGGKGGAKGLKDGFKDGTRGLLKDRGKQPNSDRPWRGRGDKDEKSKKAKGNDDASSSTARDGLEPKDPKGGGGDEVVDAELVDDDLPPMPDRDPDGVIDAEVIDAEVIDDEVIDDAVLEDRIALVRDKREKAARRAAIREGKRAADKAARTGDGRDPREVKAQVIHKANQRIDVEIHHQDNRLALAKATNERRSSPVNYPAIQVAPSGTRQAGAAVARQIDFRGSTAYALLRAMADQLAHGLHNDEDADMADHIVELTGIPNMCRNLGTAVQEAGRALGKTAPLNPTVIKHLNAAAVAARTAGLMAENIMVVFVQAHREDIIRVLDPRIGEERWNLRNGAGTLDAAKLRAAIATAHSARLALPAGSSTSGPGQQTSGKLVPASDASTKKLVDLMKSFIKGHMVNVLSEIAGSAAGVDAVADAVNKLYVRMSKTWPTEGVVDETVRKTAGQVGRVSSELKKAIKAAQKAHARELKLNAKPRKGARAEKKWDVVGRPGRS